MPFLSRAIESLLLHPEVRLPVVAEEVVLATELDVAHQLAEVEICDLVRLSLIRRSVGVFFCFLLHWHILFYRV